MPFKMTPTTRQITLVRLLVDIEQRIEIAKDVSDNPMLSRDERHHSEHEFRTNRDTAALIEKMLTRIAGESAH